MKLFITGATGFIGRALTLRLLRDGHSVVAWVRSIEEAQNVLEPGVELVSTTDQDGLRRHLSSCGAVFNLAGEPILVGRWSAARREKLVQSRVALTREVVAAMAAAPRDRDVRWQQRDTGTRRGLQEQEQEDAEFTGGSAQPGGEEEDETELGELAVEVRLRPCACSHACQSQHCLPFSSKSTASVGSRTFLQPTRRTSIPG